MRVKSTAKGDVVALRVDVAETGLREAGGEVVAGAGERGAKCPSASLSRVNLSLSRTHSASLLRKLVVFAEMRFNVSMAGDEDEEPADMA